MSDLPRWLRSPSVNGHSSDGGGGFEPCDSSAVLSGCCKSSKLALFVKHV